MKQKKYGLAILLILSLILGIYPSYTVQAKGETPKQIILSSKNQTIYTDQSITLKVKKTVPKGASTDVRWSSSNKKVARVTKSGKVTGIKAGTATITAVSKKDKTVKASCKVKVLKYKAKTIKAKKSYTSSSNPYLKSSGKTYRVITSYKELTTFKKDMQKQYKKYNSPGTKAYFQKSALGKKLNKYKESYFESKVLIVIEGSTASSSRRIEIGDFKLSQNKKGKVCGNLYVSEILPKGANETGDMSYQQYFIEPNKKDIRGIQSYRLIQNKLIQVTDI